jgi:hypothetical protein
MHAPPSALRGHRAWILAVVLLAAIAYQPEVAHAACGDGICSGDESDANCAEDCGCSAEEYTCGWLAPYGCFCDSECAAVGDCCADAEVCYTPTDGQGAEAICDGFGSLKAGFFKRIQLRGTKLDFQAVVLAWRALGWTEAAVLMDHYLKGSGVPLSVDVDDLIADLPSFENKIEAWRKKLGEERVAARRQASATGRNESPIPFDWCHNLAEGDACGHAISFDEDKNWYFALRSWGFRHAGTIMVELVGNAWRYKVESEVVIQKDYNFDPDKTLFGIDFERLAEMHCYGWAQEFLVYGTSSVDSYEGTVAQ